MMNRIWKEGRKEGMKQGGEEGIILKLEVKTVTQ